MRPVFLLDENKCVGIPCISKWKKKKKKEKKAVYRLKGAHFEDEKSPWHDSSYARN